MYDFWFWFIIVVVIGLLSFCFCATLVFSRGKDHGSAAVFLVLVLLGSFFSSLIIYERGKGAYAQDGWENPIPRGEIYQNIATVELYGEYLVIMTRYDEDPEFYKVFWRPPEVGKCFIVVDGEKTHAQEVECKKVQE